MRSALATRPKRAGEFYESNVYELIVNCATGCFLRAPQARGVNRLEYRQHAYYTTADAKGGRRTKERESRGMGKGREEKIRREEGREGKGRG